MPPNDPAALLTSSLVAQPAPPPLLIAALAIVMLVTLGLGLFHAVDREEEVGVRWIGGVLAALSLGALIATVHAGIA